MNAAWSSLVCACALLVVAGCSDDATDTPDAGKPVDRDAHTIVVLPDTQFYACEYPEIFEAQTRWIAENAAARHIGLVIHTGDMVDSDVDTQWRVARESMALASNDVPCIVTTGNHDLSPARASLVSNYFMQRTLEAFEIEVGFEDPRRIDNSYAVVRIAGRDWLVLGLEFGPRDRIVEWADGVLSDHAELPAILFTHAYLYSDGQRYDRMRVPPQPYHPDGYGQTPEQGINDGEDLWRKLIEPHDNIRLVLSGHVIPDGTAHSTAPRPSGVTAHQILANYQQCDVCPCEEVEGGGGYLRLLEFAGDEVRVSTYSPHYARSLTDSENEFTLPL